ncbi:MAG: type III-A CRISPR-associated protein Csm2 [Bacteroidia bacterium]|nr:type III-A CRISPR-associated protein Csm2 [Bacteroidia bacterium]
MAKTDKRRQSYATDHLLNNLLNLKLKEISGDPEKMKGMNALVTELENLVRHYAKSITTSQLRNIYSVIKEMQEDEMANLVLLRPKLAYISARQQKKEAQEFTQFISDLISRVNSRDDFRNFKTVMEAIVAYHKLYNNQNN